MQNLGASIPNLRQVGEFFFPGSAVESGEPIRIRWEAPLRAPLGVDRRLFLSGSIPARPRPTCASSLPRFKTQFNPTPSALRRLGAFGELVFQGVADLGVLPFVA